MPLAPPETLYVDKTVVACDGGSGALGHPRVYLNMGKGKQAACPYCDRLFLLQDAAKAPGDR